MRVLGPLILSISSILKTTVCKQCGIPASGQQDPFGLRAQLTGSFVPPIPRAPVGFAVDRNQRWIPFKKAKSSTGWNKLGLEIEEQKQFTGIKWRSNSPRVKRNALNITRTLYRVKRIVGGYDAAYGQLCWQVKVVVGNIADQTICGGSIVGSRSILIAAHCLYNEKTRRRVSDSQITIVAGGMDRDVGEGRSVDPTGCAESYTVQNSVVNPSYNYDLNDNDIAVIVLTRPIDLDRKRCACAICLNSRQPQIGEWCIVSGFGEESNNGQSDRNPVPLKWTQLQILANDYSGRCAFNSFGATSLRPAVRTNVDLFLCAGSQRFEDTCKGDSGGPMVCLDPNRGTYYQAGITSFGDDCGAGVGGQYTKVAAYIRWIVATSPLGDVADVTSFF